MCPTTAHPALPNPGLVGPVLPYPTLASCSPYTGAPQGLPCPQLHQQTALSTVLATQTEISMPPPAALAEAPLEHAVRVPTEHIADFSRSACTVPSS